MICGSSVSRHAEERDVNCHWTDRGRASRNSQIPPPGLLVAPVEDSDLRRGLFVERRKHLLAKPLPALSCAISVAEARVRANWRFADRGRISRTFW
jgi:hypothetical protein